MADTEILSLEDAKDFLDITSGTDDVKLQGVINAAAAAVEDRVGPIDTATYTWATAVGSGRADLVFPLTNVTGVTSVKNLDGTDALTVSDLSYAAGEAGIVWLKVGWWPATPLVIVYTVGRTPNAKHIEAVKLMTQHLWKNQRGSGQGGVPGTGSDSESADTVSIPAAVDAVLKYEDENLGFA